MVYVYKKNKQINKWNERLNTPPPQKKNKNNDKYKNTSTVGIWIPNHRDCHE